MAHVAIKMEGHMSKAMSVFFLLVLLLVGWGMFHYGAHSCCSINHQMH